MILYLTLTPAPGSEAALRKALAVLKALPAKTLFTLTLPR